MKSEVSDNFTTVSSSKFDDDLIIKQNDYSSNLNSIDTEQNYTPRKEKAEKHLRIKSSIMPLNDESINRKAIEDIDELQKKRKQKAKLIKSAILPINENRKNEVSHE